MPDTTYQTPNGPLVAYLATPSSPGPWPGVVVVHEAFGLNDDIRAQADRLAAAGYLAVAPDLYSYGVTVRCLVATFRTLLSGGRGRAVTDIDAARDYLVDDARCTGKVGVIGFCMGGGFAILAASRSFDAASPNYGLAPDDLDSVLAGSCPLVASYGARDRQLRGVAGRLDRTLTSAGVDHDVKEYADAGHAFLFRHTGRWGWVERVPGLGYVPVAADDGWRRVLAFFDRHLGGPAGAAGSRD